MDKVLNMLGLSQRARKAVSGGFSVEKAVREKTAALVIVTVDASDNTKKKFTDKCSFYNVPIVIYGDKASLGHALGQQERTSAAVLDPGFAEAILKLTEK